MTKPTNPTPAASASQPTSKDMLCPTCGKSHHIFQCAPSSTVRIAGCGQAYYLNGGPIIKEQVSASRHTPEPWKHVLGHDTHNVKRDAKGRMLGPVTMGMDDYDRAMDCVNALAGMNPEAVKDVVDALKFAEQSLSGTECSGLKQLSTGQALDKARAALAKLRS